MKKLLFLFIALSLFIFVSCSNQENDTEKKAGDHSQREDDIPVPHGQADIAEDPVFTYPLTGEETSEEITDRIIAVMVNNHPKARPQTGLSQADIVFEILAEGHITRLMALYQSSFPDRVGPVRSARPYYFNLADDYNAIYVYHGAANFIEDMIRNGAAEGLNGMYYDNDKELFERTSDRVAPHNSYTIMDGIFEKAVENDYLIETEYEPLPFSDEKEVEGDPASKVEFSYGSNSVKYVYDETEEHYFRYSDGAQTIEKENSNPVALENILILETTHQVIDNAGRREIDLESGGNALLLQRGKVQDVQWERIDGRIIPTIDGNAVPFLPGQTWINVIPTDPGINGVQLSNPLE